MASGSRLSDVIVKLPVGSAFGVERRLVIKRSPEAVPVHQYVFPLQIREVVTWLSAGKCRMPGGSIAVAVARKRP